MDDCSAQPTGPLIHSEYPSPGRDPQIELPLPNYTLSTVCPACAHPTVRRACKVRCERCGFMWDCSEL